ncbi:MAG: adenylosuccinate synthase [Chloroflexi bacterium]|nr:MAG: adenylosuccinate synthase [Chloroflexota bacterium]
MSVVAIIGGQWGDEGKGRVVDLLAQHAHMVIRYSGGNNAGHTVINDRGTFKLHLVPAGIFNPETTNIIGTGVVVDPAALLEELAMLAEAGVTFDNLYISDRAHVIMPYHREQDRIQESLRGDGRIGTTGRGVGPAYGDKMERIGIRMGDLLHADTLHQHLARALDAKNTWLQAYGGKAQPLQALHQQFVDYGHQLRAYIKPTHPLVQQALSRGQDVLLEGAQASLLDVDWGTYPYVTSSAPGAAGACQGAGIGPRQVSHVLGVFKAYTTRIGGGPFPTELTDETGNLLRERGHEYGTTTGRPRRCGWFDAVAARYVVELNGIDYMVWTKLDILDTLPTIRICTSYKLRGETIHYVPSSIAELSQVEPIYEDLPGWQTPTDALRTFDDLPPNAKRYLQRLEELTGVPTAIISVGPARQSSIERVPVAELFA